MAKINLALKSFCGMGPRKLTLPFFMLFKSVVLIIFLKFASMNGVLKIFVLIISAVQERVQSGYRRLAGVYRFRSAGVRRSSDDVRDAGEMVLRVVSTTSQTSIKLQHGAGHHPRKGETINIWDLVQCTHKL